MTADQGSVERVVMTRMLRVHAGVNGIVTGLIAGLGIFLATNWLVLKGGPVVGPHLALLAQFLVGYRVTFAGSLIGFGYGFVLGFAIAYAISWLYNQILERRHADAPVPARRAGRDGGPS